MKQSESMCNIDISVVMPVKNGQRYLDYSLRAVFAQQIDKEFEVIIIDSGSSDKTIDIIRKYPVRLYQINEQTFNHGLTRNFGVSRARGRYVILMTQDAMPADNYWMKKLVDNLEHGRDVAGAYSRQIPHLDSSLLTRLRVNRFFVGGRTKRENRIGRMEDFEKLSPKEKYRLCNFDNVSSCIKKSVWEKLPFPKTDFAEDLEWAKSALEAGYKIIYEPESAVYHSHDFAVRQWYQRNRLNYKKLHALFGVNHILFGVNTINSIYKALAFFFIYTVIDIYRFCKEARRLKIIPANTFLIIAFSFFELLGQYQGIRDSRNYR